MESKPMRNNEKGYLSPEQQKLVADNHNLIYSFAYKYKIDIGEYYDVLALGLCKAAMYHDGVSGKFSTLAYQSMKTVYLNEVVYYDKRSKRGSNKKAEYYEEFISDDESRGTYFDLFSDIKMPDEDSIILNLLFQEFCCYITNREFAVLKMKFSGMTQKEISKEYGVTHQMVSLWLKEIKKKAEYFFKKEGWLENYSC